MALLVRRLGSLGAAILAVALPAAAPAQAGEIGLDVSRDLGIDQKLGAAVPRDVTLVDETSATRTFGSVLKGRPVLVLPFPLRRLAGCGIAIDGLEKTLFRAAHPNERKLVSKKGPDRLRVGKDLDLVFLSIDPHDKPLDASATKSEFEKQVGYDAEPVTCLLGDAKSVRRLTDALGFRYVVNEATGALWNPTGAALLTPDGRISSYTVGNDFQTVEMERNLEIATAGKIGTKSDATSPFACVQLASSVIERRGKIETVITGFALLTLAIVAFWIASMLRAERRAANRDRQSSIVNP